MTCGCDLSGCDLRPSRRATHSTAGPRICGSADRRAARAPGAGSRRCSAGARCRRAARRAAAVDRGASVRAVPWRSPRAACVSARSARARPASSAGSGSVGNAGSSGGGGWLPAGERGLGQRRGRPRSRRAPRARSFVIRRPPPPDITMPGGFAPRVAQRHEQRPARANARGVLVDVRVDELGPAIVRYTAAGSRRPATASRRATCSSSSMISCACMSAVCAPNMSAVGDGRLGAVEVEEHAVVQRDDHLPGRHRLHRVADVLVPRGRERRHRGCRFLRRFRRVSRTTGARRARS